MAIGRYLKADDKMERSPVKDDGRCPTCHEGIVPKVYKRGGIDCWFCERELERSPVKRSDNPIKRALRRFS